MKKTSIKQAGSCGLSMNMWNNSSGTLPRCCFECYMQREMNLVKIDMRETEFDVKW